VRHLGPFGGYCNGLARATEIGARRSTSLLSSCNDRVGEVSRSVISWSLIGALGGLLKPKK